MKLTIYDNAGKEISSIENIECPSFYLDHHKFEAFEASDWITFPTAGSTTITFTIVGDEAKALFEQMHRIYRRWDQLEFIRRHFQTVRPESRN